MFTGPGPGRPKGLKNKQTSEQRKFAEEVCYGRDGKGRQEFVDMVRLQLLTGTLPQGVYALLLYYLLGKPVERVEVRALPADYSDMTAEQLRERALQIASRSVIDVSPEPHPELTDGSGSTDLDEAVH